MLVYKFLDIGRIGGILIMPRVYKSVYQCVLLCILSIILQRRKSNQFNLNFSALVEVPTIQGLVAQQHLQRAILLYEHKIRLLYNTTLYSTIFIQKTKRSGYTLLTNLFSNLFLLVQIFRWRDLYVYVYGCIDICSKRLSYFMHDIMIVYLFPVYQI